MAVAKVCGIETEYGIHHVGGDGNPVASSSLLVNAYVSDLARAGWDFEDESPGNDARGFAREGALPPEVETHLVNAVLTNGARYYVDHAHPEFSTPECADRARGRALRPGRRGGPAPVDDGRGARAPAGPVDRRLQEQLRRQGQLVRHPRELSDGPRRALRSHRAPRHTALRHAPDLRRGGQGGSETLGNAGRDVTFQISQRAEFFEEEIGLETTLKRPIVNTRDEPHADPQRYRRLHVIVGDANLSEVATFLKVGTTALVLAMIEDDAFGGRDLTLANPVKAIRQVSFDLSLTTPLDLADGRTTTALGLQWELYGLARKYAEDRGLECLGDEVVGQDVLQRWEDVLHGLETDPTSWRTSVDWVAKLQLLEAYRERHGLDWDDHRLAAVDLQYHDLRPERSLFARLDTERWLTDRQEVLDAVTEPPRQHAGLLPGPVPQALGRDRWPAPTGTRSCSTSVPIPSGASL